MELTWTLPTRIDRTALLIQVEDLNSRMDCGSLLGQIGRRHPIRFPSMGSTCQNQLDDHAKQEIRVLVVSVRPRKKRESPTLRRRERFARIFLRLPPSFPLFFVDFPFVGRGQSRARMRGRAKCASLRRSPRAAVSWLDLLTLIYFIL